MDWAQELKKLEGWSFGDNAEMADELAALVLEGKKTATSSLLAAYEEDEPLPVVGDISYIKNSKGEPLCVIELMQVKIKPFKDIDVSLAIAEGEGDLSLKFWRTGHENFFKKYCSDFTEEFEVVSEYFKVLHKF